MPNEINHVRLPAIGGSKHKQHISGREIVEFDDEGFFVSRRFAAVTVDASPPPKPIRLSAFSASDFEARFFTETYTPRTYCSDDRDIGTYYALASMSDAEAWEKFKRWLLPDRA